MAFCPECGNTSSASAAFCVACGTEAAPSPTHQPAAPASIARTEDISQSWKEKFATIEKAGGTKLPKMSELNFRERLVVFNVWAWLFGPFYYLAKGMWKKAIVLTVVCLLAVAVLDVVCEAMGMSAAITKFIGAAVFATRANIDYYKKMVLRDNGWW